MKSDSIKSTILIQASLDDLAILFNEGFKSQFKDFKKELHLEDSKEELLNRQEVLELLKINPTTLWNYQNKGKIPFYKFANKCYYKRSEIMQSLIKVKNK